MEQYHSPEITELAKVMLQVQAALQPAFKDRENTFSKSRYATLNSVMEACKEALISNGIWLVQHPVPVEPGNLGLITKLVHTESGQWQSSLLTMPLPKADPQGYGSALTYARRYALSAMLGIVAEDDDDGNGASQGVPVRKRRMLGKVPAEQPVSSPQSQQVQLHPPQQHSVQSHPALSAIPKIDGVAYSVVPTQDDKLCIVATGDTRSKKQLLIQAGFKWSEQKKMWWRYADAA